MENDDKNFNKQPSNLNQTGNENFSEFPSSPLNTTANQTEVVPAQVESKKFSRFPKFSFKDQRKPIILFASLILLILVSVVISLLTKNKSKSNVVTQLVNIDCSLSRQKEKVETSDEPSRKAGGFDEEYN